jgi:hypothetical protein
VTQNRLGNVSLYTVNILGGWGGAGCEEKKKDDREHTITYR